MQLCFLSTPRTRRCLTGALRSKWLLRLALLPSGVIHALHADAPPASIVIPERSKGICFFALATALLCTSGARAQEGKQLPLQDTPYTLHVYEDLVQVPTLVLNSLHGSYRGLNAAHFTLRLDAGPPFHPRHVRLEGDDPINLSFLLDVSSPDAARLLESFGSALAKLPPDLFHPDDRISVFAYDCSLVRSLTNVPASLPALRAGVASALAAPGLHQRAGAASPCGPTRLWDAIAGVAVRVGELPGRRVLFIVSTGDDGGSSNTWNTVRSYADNLSLALFGVRPALPTIHLPPGSVAPPPYVLHVFEDPFDMLCGGTGGLALDVAPGALALTLDRVVDLLRHRYIVEFPRPSNGTAGVHQLLVNIPDKSAIIRSTGIVVPVPDKAVLNDPSTVPSDPTRAPIQGDRRVLTQPH